jgi:NlpC/P60 family putative phage cell wall peptidase
MSRHPSTLSSAIVAEARSWLGTPYHHMADIKGVGVDCGMILVRVYCGLGLVDEFDPRPYTRDWHLHRSEEIYLQTVERCADEIDREDLDLGDIVVFRVGRCYSHGGIVVDLSPLRIVHPYMVQRLVVEDEIDSVPELYRAMNTARFFRVRSR